MSVSAVKVVSIIGVDDNLDSVVDFCGRSNIFEPAEVFSFYSDTKGFVSLLEVNPFEAPLKRIDSLLASAEKKLPANNAESSDLDKAGVLKYIRYFSNRIENILDKKDILNKKLDAHLKQMAQIEHFTGLDLDFNKIKKLKYVKIRFGRMPKESINKISSYKENQYLMFIKCTEDITHYWGLYIVPVEHAEEVDLIFSNLYFERIKLYNIDSTLEEEIKDLRKKIKFFELQLKIIDEKLEHFWLQEDKKCSRIYDKLLEYYTYYNIRKYGAKYNKSFIITGWIPKEEQSLFEEGLDKIEGIEYAIENAEETRSRPPIILKNKKIFKPFEFFVDMYGLPNYKEVDPTVFVAITYVLMFGIMFGDFGNGLVLSIVGYLMWKLKKMKLGRVLIPCGISSMIFGFLFGSCFGFENAFDWFYKGILNLGSKPISVTEPNTTNMIIYLSIVLGFIVILTSMIINIFSLFKQKLLGMGLFGPNGVCGLLFYTSLVMGIATQLLLNIKIMTLPYVIFLIIVPLILILFNEMLTKLINKDPNWKPESFGDYIAQNFFELFEVILSYATNTLSFLRVGAYVLVHAGMLLVVFTLAEMASGLGYILIVAVGNALVIALEGLLVGIQVLRLEFYEVFSRFYKGDGKAFKPVVAKKLE